MRGRKKLSKLRKRRQANAIKESTSEAGDPLLVVFLAMKQDVFKGVRNLANMTKNILNEMKMKKKCRSDNYFAYEPQDENIILSV